MRQWIAQMYCKVPTRVTCYCTQTYRTRLTRVCLILTLILPLAVLALTPLPCPEVAVPPLRPGPLAFVMLTLILAPTSAPTLILALAIRQPEAARVL